MLVLGTSVTASVRVGGFLGAEKGGQARQSAIIAMAWGLCESVVNMLICFHILDHLSQASASYQLSPALWE